MNGNGNGKKVRATETWPDAGAMERVGVVGNVHWRFGVRRMSAVGCRRSVGRGQCFWCRFGPLSKKFHSFLQYFLNPLYFRFPNCSGSSPSDGKRPQYTGEGQKSTGSSSETVHSSNGTDNHDDHASSNGGGEGGAAASSLVQGMKHLAVSPGRGQQPPPGPGRSPPSPRQQALKKMQNNDEEDW